MTRVRELSLSTVMAVVAALATAYPTARSVLADQVSDQITSQVRPLQQALLVQTRATVRNLRASISAMEFKRDMCAGVPACWTLPDQQSLNQTRADLEAAQKALQSLGE